MRFLALTGLQAAALALSTAGIVIALFFLKVRRRRVTVSSSLLWRRVLEQQVARSLFHRLRSILSILLALAISLLIALAIARPHIDWLTGRIQRIVIVLDTSPTMNTRTADGRTRWDHAADEAQMLVEDAGPAAEFRIAETSGEAVSGFTADRNETLKQIERLSPRAVEPRFPLLDGDESHVYFFSDGVALHGMPPGVEPISVFEPANNVGITAFDIRPVPSNGLEYEAYLEVYNFGEQAQIGVTLSGAAQDRIMRTVNVAAGQQYREIFNLSDFDGGAVQASILAKDDALASDNIATAHLPVRRKMRILLVTGGNRLLETLLQADSSVDLQMIDPAGYQERPDIPDIDAYVFDRFVPPNPPAGPALMIGSKGAAQEPKTTNRVQEHPIMRHVTLHAESNDIPLIHTSEQPRQVLLALDTKSSDFAFQPGFPIFIRNVLAWLTDTPPVMHASNPLFFNVNDSVLQDELPAPQRGSWLRHELWFYMLLAAVVLIGAEWWTYHRRITL